MTTHTAQSAGKRGTSLQIRSTEWHDWISPRGGAPKSAPAASSFQLPPLKISDLSRRRLPKFEYTALLDASKTEIRLFKVLPPDPSASRWQDPVRCVMLPVTRLDDKPDYMAISYVWGEAKGFETIILDDSVLTVPKSLVIALRHLRHKELTFAIWCDSICINQRDTGSEKVGQIRLMERIYSQASFTLIWMGTEADDSAKAITALQQITYDIGRFRGSSLQEQEKYWLDLLSRDGEDAIPLEAICKLMTRKWWSRVWCLQESQLAPGSLAVIGRSVIPLSSLAGIATLLQYAGIFASDEYPDLEDSPTREKNVLYLTENLAASGGLPLGMTLEARNTHKAERRYPLSEILELVCTMEATDPRDFIYGILGIVSDVDQRTSEDADNEPRADGKIHIIVDYNRTCSEAWMNATEGLIAQSNKLTLLSWCENQFRDQPPPTLWGRIGGKSRQKGANKMDDRHTRPSWVPDFSRKHAFRRGGIGYQDRAYRLYSASNNLPLPDGWTVDKATRSLRLSAFYVDTICEVSPRPPKANLSKLMYSKQKSHARGMLYHGQIEQFLVKSARYSHDQDALCRILICNHYFHIKLSTRYVRAEPAGEGAKSAYQAFLVLDTSGPPSAPGSSPGEDYLRSMGFVWDDQTSFITDSGYIGIGPHSVHPGDRVFILPGANTPYILRPIQPGDPNTKFELVGAAYVDGIMNAEFFTDKGTNPQRPVVGSDWVQIV